ncbi:MAG: tRNA (adenosine(37)-N6)-dimethylallyltransferase MiaA [Trueperaceae bacterium]
MKIPVIAGPTASGKTALALELARHVPLEVISADAMMVYQGMDIGTAKPTRQERTEVTHHLLDVVSPDEPFSVADYVRLAERAIHDVLEQGKIPLVVGGTGFYIRALSEGLPTTPVADADVQAQLYKRLEEEGLESLLNELTGFSPEDAQRSERNPRRIVRALEIIQRTGKAPKDFPMTSPKFSYDNIIFMPSAEELQPHIVRRTEAMFKAGLVNEVIRLFRHYPKLATAQQAIGYKEVIAHLAGEASLEVTKAAITLATTQYAKRQRTWFRKETGKVYPSRAMEARAECVNWLNQKLKAIS